jgi:hypothetical protein
LLFIDFEHIQYLNVSAPSVVKKRAGFLYASSQMTLSLLVSQISLILIEAPMVVGKRTKNLPTLSLLKAKISADAEFMQTSLNYGGSCNILLYATMNQHS